MPRRRSKPLFENLEMLDAGAKGKAVAKAPDGRVVFVNNAVPGDIADVQTFKKRRAYYEGSAVSFSKYSDRRTEPRCEHFGVCGGCKWQYMKYEDQLYFKQQEVVNNLKRLGGIQLPDITPIVGSDEHYNYRNKMEYSFSDSKWLTQEQVASDHQIPDRRALGFHKPGMWDKVVDIDQCHLPLKQTNAIRNFLRDFARKENIPFFNLRNQAGTLRTLMIRTTLSGEVMVLVQFFDPDQNVIDTVMEAIKTNFPEINSLLYVINQKSNDTLYDQDILCYHGQDYITETMEGLQFRVTAKSFYQTNSAQAYRLYQLTREMAGLTGGETVYDLYTGTGTIAQFVAAKAGKVVGVESVPEAIDAARINARLNSIDNVEFVVGDMKQVMNSQFIEEHGAPDVIITDPPRDGMHKDVVQTLIHSGVPKIVYVSCNSATQARDLSLMDDHYKVTAVQPVDMFPHTAHVENIVLLEKR
ncbi:23S rRNA (uracil(1939)-C(5))-methyltransferase RlmD [Aureitalea marina]|uniref:23S rRNA (Uracil-5-)-methyltransferase RumA n=1 Tax=Aureitalea marina TaxID=930804 RepID=A0A2S7KNX6_9FLAO|nr:23S rRNA (uracil(1939)-C(5))-methyltransferase RlmD [Aureitalea marina]PQB04273.1 23S rRNA (uracil-5-)-methyltransferase RumA [Aureitalea marina]